MAWWEIMLLVLVIGGILAFTVWFVHGVIELSDEASREAVERMKDHEYIRRKRLEESEGKEDEQVH